MRALIVALLLLLAPAAAQLPDGTHPFLEQLDDVADDPAVYDAVCPKGACPVDTDGDRRYDPVDNCPIHSNSDQADLDGDGLGDPCDGDRDGDGHPNDEDAFPDNPDYHADRDGDGVADPIDAFPDDPEEWADSDGDGVGDNADLCARYDDALDRDGDGAPDACDDDVVLDGMATGDGWALTLLDDMEAAHVQVDRQDGMPVMTFVGEDSDHLWFAWFDGTWHMTALDHVGFFAGPSALTTFDGQLAVVYFRFDESRDDGDLLMAVQGDAGWTIEPLDAGPEDRGEAFGVATYQGRPLVAYTSYDDGFLRVVQPGGSPVLVDDSLNTLDGAIAVDVIGGVPTIAYMDWGFDVLALATMNFGTWTTTTLDHGTGLGGELALDERHGTPLLMWDCYDCDSIYLGALDGGLQVQAIPAPGLSVQSLAGHVVGDVPVIAFTALGNATGLFVASDVDGYAIHQVHNGSFSTGIDTHADEGRFTIGFGTPGPAHVARDVLSWLGPGACTGRDVDGDGLGDACDGDPHDGPYGDLDGDGTSNQDDVCPGFDDRLDQDGDGRPDGCDDDLDGDGKANDDDWAPSDPTEWRDRDGDGVGDNADNCKRHNPTQHDADGDGKGDACDSSDTDGDGASDKKEHQAGTDPNDASSFPADVDRDGDGVADKQDNCRKHANSDQSDLDGDGKGDACDNDIDGDGFSNKKERKSGSNPRDAASRPGDEDDQEEDDEDEDD